MTRVLFCVIPEKGHLHPYLGPAECLSAAGVEVAFFSGYPAGGEPTRGASFAENVRDASWLRGFIRTLLVDSVPALVEPIRQAIATFRPEVVAIDPMLYAAAIAAELEGVPWAAISNSLNPVLPDALDSELLRTVRALAPERQAAFDRHGLRAEFRGCDLLSPWLTIAFTTPELLGRKVDGVQLVGPSLPRGVRGDEPDFPWERLSTRPLVYLSFGSQICHQPALVRRAFAAMEGRPLQLVVSCGELATSGELGAVPDNVIAVEYAPQLALLRRARAFITHGGANSVMEAITYGVPLLVSPLCNDQFHQAHFVEAAGIGRVIDLATTSRTELATALEGLVAPGSIRDRMATVSASYAIDGAAETARLVIELAGGSRPAPTS